MRQELWRISVRLGLARLHAKEIILRAGVKLFFVTSNHIID